MGLGKKTSHKMFLKVSQLMAVAKIIQSGKDLNKEQAILEKAVDRALSWESELINID